MRNTECRLRNSEICIPHSTWPLDHWVTILLKVLLRVDLLAVLENFVVQVRGG
jgi:hypothetical protein